MLPLVLSLMLLAGPNPPPRIAALSAQLAHATRPAARVAAARALGQSDRPAVLGALCTGLKDPDGTVRAAAALALETLEEPDGLDCLRAHEADPVPAARAAILHAERALHAAQTQPSRFYVLLGATHATPPAPELAAEAEATLRRHLRRLGATFAPDGETPKRARAVLAHHRGWMSVALRPELKLSDGAVVMTLVCARYPEGRLLGEASARGKGSSPADLVHALVPRLLAEARETCGLP